MDTSEDKASNTSASASSSASASASSSASASAAMLPPASDFRPPMSVASQQQQDWLIARPPDNLPALRTTAPWMRDPKWFHSVVVSPSAVVKMLSHCDSGVAKGIAKGGNPIEVMGMLLGRPNENHQLVVTDAFPLPIEGFETRVVADDQAVVNHMIALGESLERTRCEKFMGWCVH
jgi:COP9 signalosome complex subunit 5